MKSRTLKDQPSDGRPSGHTPNDYLSQIGPYLSIEINVSYEDKFPGILKSMVFMEINPNPTKYPRRLTTTTVLILMDVVMYY